MREEIDEEVEDDQIDWESVGSARQTVQKPAESIIDKLNKAAHEKSVAGSCNGSGNRTRPAGSVIEILNERASQRGSTIGGSEKGTGAKPTSAAKPTNMGEKTLFKTPKPEGCMRDVIIIEVRFVNGEVFTGTLTKGEACVTIFQEILGFKSEQLHGVKFAFSGYPVIRFKLTEQINIDSLYSQETFDFTREGSKDIIGCRIRGIRKPQYQAKEKSDDEDSDPNVRWVTVDGCDYELEEEEIMSWLRIYGETFGKLREDIHHNTNPDADLVGTGSYSIQMRIDQEIPQMLPMYGKKVSISFRGVQALCGRCYGKHNRRSCQSRKVEWIEYIEWFQKRNPEIEKKMYGRWARIVEENSRKTKVVLLCHRTYRKDSFRLLLGIYLPTHS